MSSSHLMCIGTLEWCDKTLALLKTTIADLSGSDGAIRNQQEFGNKERPLGPTEKSNNNCQSNPQM